MTTEYTITRSNQYFTTSGGGQWTSRIGFATVFKGKERASKIAKKVGGDVEAFYGAPVKSNKSFVVPKQSLINSSSPYRSI